jgi:hypothetical protein
VPAALDAPTEAPAEELPVPPVVPATEPDAPPTEDVPPH